MVSLTESILLWDQDRRYDANSSWLSDEFCRAAPVQRESA
jgi:hypothetical protein